LSEHHLHPALIRERKKKESRKEERGGTMGEKAPKANNSRVL